MALVERPQGFGLGFSGAGPGSRPERFGELVARGDVELAVDVAQVPLDGFHSDELALRYLPVGEAFRGERRHAVLARGQRLATRQHAPVAARTCARGDELLMSAVGQTARPHPSRLVEGFAQDVARLDALTRTPERRTELEQRARVLEAALRPLEHVDRRP